ncbi:MAG: glycosyltransferase [Desulfovibrionales bacterium]|nr:glycosyltransferase [Desulfovibrionales bacterium]
MIVNDPFKKYRKQFRAWKNKRRLERELDHYNSIFASRHLTIPDDRAIRHTIKQKIPRLKAKRRGELHILAIYHHYNWENESLKPALAKFGTVRHYDWFDEFNHQQKDWHKSVKAAMNEDLVNRIGRWVKEDNIDVIFTYLSGELVTPETMQALRAFGVPMLNLALNDKEHFVGKIRQDQAMGSRDICRYFDLCWTSTEDALKKYCVEGALPVYLPEGANPEIHRPCDVDKTIDVSFVGQCYGNRPAVIERLKEQGIKVEPYGYGWPNGPLSTEDMVRMYSRSKINLGFGGVVGHKDTYCLKGRDFEIPMSGGLYLTEYNRELEQFYDLGTDIVTYTGLEDLVSKIQDLLSNPEKAEAIRKSGYRRAHREHTWEMRFERIFRLMGLI